MLNIIFKKGVCFALCVVLLVGNIAFSVSAQEGEFVINLNETTLSLNKFASVENESKAIISNNDKALSESINTQLKNFYSSVNISKFRLKYNNETTQKLIDILSGDLPECFHIGDSFRVGYQNNYITYLEPTYIYSKAEYKSMLAECESAADAMLADIENNSRLTDVEKLLLLHDRIAVTCEYDYENYVNDNIPKLSFTMYGVFAKKVAVCQGYALAYTYLLDRIGIENYYCSSNQLYHAWNVVYVNGKPYHVDITWDDPVWDVTGKVEHTNFLVSTQKLKETHKADDFDTLPTDTTYDNYFWQNSEAEFVQLNNEIYYIDVADEQIILRRYSDKKALYSVEHYWMANAFQRWVGGFARLAGDGKNLLFSLSDGIYRFNLNSQSATKIYTPTKSGYFSIYGFTYKDGMLVYELNTSPSFNANTKKLYGYKVPYVPYVSGDIDGSNAVDLKDVVIVAQAFAGWGSNQNQISLDFNGDGAENLKDLIHLAQYVAGWQGIVLH
jgi:hypothetical protein